MLVVLQFLDPTGEVGNQYVPYSSASLETAMADLKASLEIFGSDDRVCVYIDHARRKELIPMAETVAIRTLHRTIPLYRLTNAIQSLALR